MLAFILIELFTLKVHIRGFHNKFITHSHLLYQRGPLGLPSNGDKKLMMTFLRFDTVSFQPINLNTIIPYLKDTITTFDFNIHNVTTRFKISHKGPS